MIGDLIGMRVIGEGGGILPVEQKGILDISMSWSLWPPADDEVAAGWTVDMPIDWSL